MNKKSLLELSEEDKTGIVGLSILTQLVGGDLGLRINRKYYPLHLFKRSNYKKRRSKNYRRKNNG